MLRKLVVALFGALLLAAPVSARELVVGLAADLTAVDPNFHNHGQNNSQAMHIFETLIHIDGESKLRPLLAESWKALSPTKHEIKLRRGVKYHDGSPFTAKDVLFSFQRVIDGIPNSPGPFIGFTEGITKIEAIDDHTVHFTTAAPIPLFYKNIARIFIVSEKNGKGATTDDYTRGTAMIGTGPYKFVSWAPGASIEYVRNDDYWGDKEPWEKVTFKIMKNDSSRLAALLAGDVDIIGAVPTTDFERLTKDQRVKLWPTATNRVTFFVPGFVQEPNETKFFSKKDGTPLAENPYRNLKVRQALNMAIDRKVIVERVNQGQAVWAKQIFPETSDGYLSDYDMSKYDPEKAKQLLAEAGYPDGFKMTIHTSNDRIVNAVKTIQTVAQMWTRIGLVVEVEAMPHAVFSKRRGKFELPLFMSSWGNSLADPIGVLNPLLVCYDKEKRLGTQNRGRYCNPEMDELVAQSSIEMDEEKRTRLYQQASKIAMDDVAMMPLVFWVYAWATKPDLTYVVREDQATLAMGIRPVTQ